MKLLSTLSVLVSLAVCGTVHAQPMPGGMGGGNANQQQRAQIQKMQAQLTAEQAELKRIAEELEKDFQKKPEWQEADAALTKARADHEAARNAVLSKVYEMPEYKAALESKFAAETTLEDLAGADASPEQVKEASDALIASNVQVRKLEDDALAADPSVADTRKALTEATQAMNALNKEFKESLQLNERYLTQSDRVEDQKYKLTEAKQRLAASNRRQTQPARRPTNRGGGPPGMGGY